MNDPPKAEPLNGEVLPPEARGLRMPADAPGGFGILASMKYAAIRRVIEERERTLLAIERHESAEVAALDALGRKEAARERLRNVETIRADARASVEHAFNQRRRVEAAEREAAELDQMKRQLERIRTQEEIERAQRSLNKAKGEPDTGGSTKLDEFLQTLGRFPDILTEVNRIKAQIHAAAPDGVLGEAEQQMIDMLDAMVAGWAAKQGEAMGR